MYNGKIFVGNSGSFAIGITIASFAVISDLKLSLLVIDFALHFQFITDTVDNFLHTQKSSFKI